MLEIGIVALLIAALAFFLGIILIIAGIWVNRATRIGLYFIAGSGACLLLSFAFCSSAL